VNIHAISRIQRLSDRVAQQWLIRVCIVGMLACSAAVVISIGWVVSRLDEFERQGGSNGVMAVIDKCGNAYEHTITRSGEWQPDEALYFDKLEDMIDCTRGLRVPGEGGRSCWLKVWPMLGPAAYSTLMEFTDKYCKDKATCPLELAKHNVEIEILKGSTKSDDGHYRLQWREREKALKRDEYWSAVFTVKRVAATKQSVAEGNAIGMYIESFTWQRDQVVGRNEK